MLVVHPSPVPHQEIVARLPRAVEGLVLPSRFVGSALSEVPG